MEESIEKETEKSNIIRVLYIEDNRVEIKIIAKELLTSQRFKFIIRNALDRTSGIEMIKSEEFDVILLDLGLPESFGKDTFYAVFKECGAVPVIVLTGNEDEEVGIDLIKAGAQDYLIKGQVNAQLIIKSISYAIERNNLLINLNQALKEIKTLSGLVPICANCKKIRDDKGFWTQVETYISKHSNAKFSHSICPDCQKILYGKVYQ